MVDVITTTLIASGDVGQFTPAIRMAIAGRFADAVGVPNDFVSVSIAAASVRIFVSISVPTSGSAVALETIKAHLADRHTASAFLSAAVGGIVVESIDVPPSITGPTLGPSSSNLKPDAGDDSSTVVIIAAAAGGAGLVLVVGLVALRLRGSKSKNSTPTFVGVSAVANAVSATSETPASNVHGFEPASAASIQMGQVVVESPREGQPAGHKQAPTVAPYMDVTSQSCASTSSASALALFCDNCGTSFADPRAQTCSRCGTIRAASMG